ncbi:aldo/keto reductase [Granulosicoccus antarcticus]|uniref:General stress protein 69 n=1 Tax=Granulosicoccus antarcticus IMCC3135 TaxID=1192854 RepID=A0A2Z2NUX0_9GAMM|nr:aldo/keto reductase [Granulosicoccus antarcticus]ASJ72580.1 General stress protein 69 [Granulosicoccus antarcticus IMCC3135]
MSRKIGSLSVSAIGLGCMNISAGYGPADESESEALLHEALDIGINFLDTAFVYGAGHSETLIGKSLSAKRDRYVLASKCGLSPQGIDGRPETIRQQCETSLQRLQTDVIDLYYLHRVDPNVPIEESVGAMSELVRAGKVREIGLSEVSSDTLFRAQTVHPVAAVQSEYSLWSRTPEYGMLEACQSSGVAFVPFSPLGRGFLADTASDVTQLDSKDLRATIARPRFEPEAFAANEKLLVRFRQIAMDYSCTTAQLALAWLVNIQDRRLVPIPGTRDSQHMRDNAEAAFIKLDDSTIQTLDALINDSVVTGSRYTAERMAEADSEEDVTSNQK